MAESLLEVDVEDWPRPPEPALRDALAGREVILVVPQQTRRTVVLLLPLLVGTMVALLIAAGLSLRATRSALRPLDQVIQAARRIGAGRLEERLRLAQRDEIGELAEAFDSMLDRLAAALLAQRRFVADAAHELRTPLTALGGIIDMLEMGAHRGDPARIQRILDTMNREVQRLSRLVSDLLTFSRMDADRPLRLGAVDASELMAEVTQQTRLIANGQEIELQTEATPTV